MQQEQRGGALGLGRVRPPPVFPLSGAALNPELSLTARAPAPLTAGRPDWSRRAGGARGPTRDRREWVWPKDSGRALIGCSLIAADHNKYGVELLFPGWEASVFTT